MSVAETVCPSVRGAWKIPVGVVLGASGAVSALLVTVPPAWLWAAARGPRIGPAIALALGVVAVLADFAGIRPLAVHRQVPQQWGHGRPVGLVAARYGLRLGLAPATILTTWLWWAGPTVSVSRGVASAVVTALTFVFMRTFTNVVVGLGVRDGMGMSRRIRTVAACDGFIRTLGAGVALFAAVVGVF